MDYCQLRPRLWITANYVRDYGLLPITSEINVQGTIQLPMFKKYSGMYKLVNVRRDTKNVYKNTDNKCGLFGVLFNNIVD